MSSNYFGTDSGLNRLYLFSDTYGGQEEWDPLKSKDADARIATDIRSGLPNVRREFDIFGAEQITDHVLRQVLNLHAELRARGDEKDAGVTGVFINSAPRTTQNLNGDSAFYLAHLGDCVRVVATPVSALSAVKKQVTRLYHLPNENNGLYSAREQFRSSYTVALLAADHGLKLVEDDPDVVIPDAAEGVRLAYVDRFGNMVFYDNTKEQGSFLRQVNDKQASGGFAGVGGGITKLAIGDVSREVVSGTCLAAAAPGALTVYGNDGNVEIVSKWSSAWSTSDKVKNSAYNQFGRPKLGDSLCIVHNRVSV